MIQMMSMAGSEKEDGVRVVGMTGNFGIECGEIGEGLGDRKGLSVTVAVGSERVSIVNDARVVVAIAVNVTEELAPF